MSAIFDNASSIVQGNRLSLMSASTQSGKRVSQRRGPFLYTFSVEVNIMATSSENYRLVRKEISEMDGGADPLSTTIPTLTTNLGSWGTTPQVFGASQTGRFVDISGFGADDSDAVLDGDFIQFDNNGKVYQAVGDHSSNALGITTVKLNSPLITSPTDLSTVITGTSVSFNLVVDEPEFSFGFTPRSAQDNFVSPGTFHFSEIII